MKILRGRSATSIKTLPELPEVETIKKQLADSIVGCKITNVWFDNPKGLQPSPSIFIKGIKGSIIQKIDRRAKLMIFYLDGSKAFVVHLRMTGRLLIRKVGDPKDYFVHTILLLGRSHLSPLAKASGAIRPACGGTFLAGATSLELRFCDVRKFGFMRFLKDQKELEELLLGYGPEPLDDLNLEKFRQILSKNRRSIKEVLMDQKLISGIGNIYANDGLWLAKTHPLEPANKVDAAIVFRAIEKVLAQGLKDGGASDQWYVNAFGGKGKYQEHFKVYGRKGKPCLQCKTIIKRIVIASRGTFFCPKCQIL